MTARNRRRRKSWIVRLMFAGALVGALFYGRGLVRKSRTTVYPPNAFYEVKRGDLLISVIEEGALRAVNETVIRSNLEGYTRIISLAPEGSHVQKGDLLVELDSSVLRDKLNEQELAHQDSLFLLLQARENLKIQKSLIESRIKDEELKVELAQADLEKFRDGDAPQQIKLSEARIGVLEEQVRIATERFARTQQLFKDGNATKSELEADSLSQKREQLGLEQIQEDLRLIKKFDQPNMIRMLESNLQQAKDELERLKQRSANEIAQAEADLKTSQKSLDLTEENLKLQRRQLENARILAPQDGLVVYSTSSPFQGGRGEGGREEGRSRGRGSSSSMSMSLDGSGGFRGSGGFGGGERRGGRSRGGGGGSSSGPGGSSSFSSSGASGGSSRGGVASASGAQGSGAASPGQSSAAGTGGQGSGSTAGGQTGSSGGGGQSASTGGGGLGGSSGGGRQSSGGGGGGFSSGGGGSGGAGASFVSYGSLRQSSARGSSGSIGQSSGLGSGGFSSGSSGSSMGSSGSSGSFGSSGQSGYYGAGSSQSGSRSSLQNLSTFELAALQLLGSSGIIEEGAMVRQRQELIRLPDVSRMLAEVKIHESRVRQVHPGMTAYVRVETLPGRRFKGSVRRVGILPDAQATWVNPNTKVYATDVLIEDELPDLKPGVSARAEIIITNLTKVLSVPIQAVTTYQGNQVCFAKKGAAVVPVTVTTGWFNDRFTEITSGLKEGDRVLLAPSSDEDPIDLESPAGQTNEASSASSEDSRPPNGTTSSSESRPAEPPPIRSPQPAASIPAPSVQNRESESADAQASSEGRRGRRGRGQTDPEMQRRMEEFMKLNPEEREARLREFRGQRGPGRGQPLPNSETPTPPAASKP